MNCSDVGHQVHLTGDDDPWRLDGRNTSREDGVGSESFAPWSSSATYPYYDT